MIFVESTSALHTAGVAFYQRNRSLVRLRPIKAKAAAENMIDLGKRRKDYKYIHEAEALLREAEALGKNPKPHH